MTPAQITGKAIPLGMDNVDTDLIIAAEHLKVLSRKGLGRHAFGAMRRAGDSLFDDPLYANASILVAGQNFGCGSSREHAVWALMDLGIEAVVAGGYSDIFAGNALKNGLPAIALDAPDLERVLLHARTAPVTVDLAAQRIILGASEVRFEIAADQLIRLLSGQDEIGLTLELSEAIVSYERCMPGWI